MTKQPRIGIFAGAFNPIHAGHVAFALQAIKHAKLDRLYFLPERRPRNKQGVEHFGHRVAMLQRAVKPYSKIEVLELNDVSFTIKRTLPGIRRLFPGARLVFLMGSDVASYLPDWPMSDRLIADADIVVGVRHGEDKKAIERAIAQWPEQPIKVRCIVSYAPSISSSKVREALQRRQYVAGLLSSVEQYCNRNWLYVSLA